MRHQQRTQIVDIIVAKNGDARARQPRARNQAGMRELVGDNEITRTAKSWNSTHVCEIARAEHDGRFGLLQRSELGFERFIKRMIAGHEPRRTGARAMRVDRPRRRRLQRRMLRQSQIIVRAKRYQRAPARTTRCPAPDAVSLSDRRSARASASSSFDRANSSSELIPASYAPARPNENGGRSLRRHPIRALKSATSAVAAGLSITSNICLRLTPPAPSCTIRSKHGISLAVVRHQDCRCDAVRLRHRRKCARALAGADPIRAVHQLVFSIPRKPCVGVFRSLDASSPYPMLRMLIAFSAEIRTPHS